MPDSTATEPDRAPAAFLPPVSGRTILLADRMDVPASTTLPPLTYASPAIRPALLSDRILLTADRHRRNLFVLLFAVYLLGFSGQWRLEPDSALYLTIGRNLATG